MLGAADAVCDFDPLVASPIPSVGAAEEGEKLDWAVLTKEEKLSAICSAIATEIQPYIALDTGGIEVLDLQKDREVLIAYQGACTSCPSATGAMPAVH